MVVNGIFAPLLSDSLPRQTGVYVGGLRDAPTDRLGALLVGCIPQFLYQEVYHYYSVYLEPDFISIFHLKTEIHEAMRIQWIPTYGSAFAIYKHQMGPVWGQGAQSRTRGSPFATLNGATVADVLCVFVDEGVTLEQPLHIVYASGSALAI